MKRFLAPLLLAAACFASPAFAEPLTTACQTSVVRTDDPVQMTYDQAYAALMQAGYSAEQTVYILTHSQTFEGLLQTIAAYYGLLPYKPL